MTRTFRRTGAALAVAGALLTVVALSLAIGANPVPLGTVAAVFRGEGSTEASFVVWELRVPRTAVGLLAGVALGVAGALMQAFTRNPLADPGILGVNAGAALAVALGVTVLGIRAVSGAVWFAFAGALVVTVAVYLIGSGGRGATGPIRLTLAGVALGAVLSGITTGIVLSDPDAFDAMRSWNAGSLLGRGWDVIAPVAPFVAAGLVLAAVVAPGLNSVALGDDVARAQGANLGGIRIGVIAAVTLLAGAATALAGPISFVGLMVPHIARWIFGADQRVILLVSGVVAPVVVLAADVMGRVLIAPAEVPVGIVTAFVGAPVLIALARRRRASAL
ncbi:FecCD family ABC transporter permease [Microbacterium oleivorans]|uniref:Iron chelate uptake ABC transporter family permease subunit n=1 Tax=Microbacterium oleivorans TaxID=273677 RepID=A0A7D5EUM3_9MICO|nr:iron chelate uptake ABC transporter family permease subunit [Microbacterium oleivorans]QLD11132.1 iron chelate uptake ABC transporter family permease subunit [Microbacterium oleivorans]